LSPCPFCNPAHTLLAESPHALAIADAFPVARGHALIIPRRHVASIFDLPASEQADLFTLLTRLRAQLHSELRPDAFTVGINDGAAAGQTVEHARAS
jgi:diadenosine tetraphosphate (Ap4A) HIT family hydrolase